MVVAPKLSIRSFITVITIACIVAMSLNGIAQTDTRDRKALEDEGSRALRIKDLCTVKGQEENVLQGLGYVIGLKGTGDGDNKPTVRALTRLMQGLGGQMASDTQGRLLEKEMANSKNVAAVMVTAIIPPTGAEQGSKLKCTVSAISAKSLEGGNLFLTPMLGPRADQPMVFGLAQGPITIDDPKNPTTSKIEMGCKMEENVHNEFINGNKVTLLLKPDHSSFTTAQYIEDIINDFHRSGSSSLTRGNQPSQSKTDQQGIAKAIDQMHIEVTIPSYYLERPVQFVSLIEALPLYNLKNNKRVVIQERAGVIIIGEDVTIAPVAISHKSLNIDTRPGSSGRAGFLGSGFVGVNPLDPKLQRPTLKNLVDALNLLEVPTADKIAIIKALKSQGNLYGEVIIE